MAEPAIAVAGLRKSYGRTVALQDVQLQVDQGEVFGFLGPNGAGKTTTLRILLDFIRADAGTARVLGLDPRRQGVQVRRRVGYLEGDFTVNGRQTAAELLSYLGHLRGGVARSTITDLADRLDLDLTRTIKALSKGNRQKVGLIQAFMHDPEVLILDEPTSGLDPLLQQEFTAMARETAGRGRTVFMSSHVMSEVQKTADRVGIIRDGQMVAVEDTDDLRGSTRRNLEIVFADPVGADEFADLPGVTDVAVSGPLLRCRLDGSADALVKRVAQRTVVSLTSEEPDLEEVFLDRYSGGGGTGGRGDPSR